MATVYKVLQAEAGSLQQPLPKNKVHIDDISFVRALDCEIITKLHQINNSLIAEKSGLTDATEFNRVKIQNDPEIYDSVRGMFPEGCHLYKGAGFRDKNHIQLCIVNPNAIIGYFDPRQQNNDYKKLL